MTSKTCLICEETKPLETDFRADNHSTCKACLIKRSKKWALDNPKRFRKLQDAYNQKNRTGRPPGRPKGNASPLQAPPSQKPLTSKARKTTGPIQAPPSPPLEPSNVYPLRPDLNLTSKLPPPIPNEIQKELDQIPNNLLPLFANLLVKVDRKELTLKELIQFTNKVWSDEV